MDNSSLKAISPIDGRYQNQTISLTDYFSESGLMKYRIKVEVEYFISLCNIPLPQLKEFDKEIFKSLRSFYKDFSNEDALAIKELEKGTNHDVKAVEYFLKTKFEESKLDKFKEFIHFGLTSQDINNTAVPMLLKECFENEVMPVFNEVIEQLDHRARLWENIPMLAKTHGQPASPTQMGKEIKVFIARINQQLKLLESIPYSAKFGGATGNFNAHHVSYPEINWNDFADKFIDSMGLVRSTPTTQIEHYDNLAAFFDNLKRINTILFDLCRDIWLYISMGYFKQRIKDEEVGSSTMPHKINPIDFENAEGNLGIANALYEHLSSKLPVSRLQRDLTDSTVLRNIGVPVSHSFIAMKSLLKGFEKLELDKERIDEDLNDNWVVVAEGIQSVLRREGYPQPFETLKNLTRSNQKITPEIITEFIEGLNISEEIKKELKEITPFNYTGIKS